MRGMGVWLLVCTWVSLGVLAPGEGEGEVTRDCVRWCGDRFTGRAVLCQTPQGTVWPACTVRGPAGPGTGLLSSPAHVSGSEPAPSRVSQPCPTGIFLFSSGGRPVKVLAARSSLVPQPCPEAATAGSQRSLSPGLGAGTFTCLTNNILRIDCHWSAPELGQGPSPWLLFTR